MDYSLQLTIIAILVSLLVFVWHSTIQGKKRNKGDTDSNKKSKEAPVPAGAWPLIGHLHLLGGDDQLLYRTLGTMAD